jgi:hypothetical protein
VETQKVSLLLLSCNHIALLNKKDSSILFNKQSFGGRGLLHFSFQSILRLIKIIALIQVFNLAIGFFVWLSYGYLISSWTIAGLSVGCTFLILAIKRAQENELKTNLT